MAKLSRQVKENIKTSLVLIIVALLFTTYAIYPLNNSDTLFARADIDDYNIDSLPPNEIGDFINPQWLVDTFRVDPDGLTSLACISIKDTTFDTTIGTIIIVPSPDATRDSLINLIELLSSQSYNCFTYDQRATGLSSGKYHGFGSIEATDLQSIISYLDIHSLLVQPLTIIGYDLGADAAILSAPEDTRINKVIAIEPLLTTDNMITTAKDKHNSYWFPFYNSVMYWWYNKNSGYAPTYIELENIQAVACQTILITNDNNDAINKLKEVSDNSLQIVEKNETTLTENIITYVLQ